MEASSSRIQTLKSLTTDTEALRALDALEKLADAYESVAPTIQALKDARHYLAEDDLVGSGTENAILEALDFLIDFEAPDLYPALDYLETSIRAAK